MAALGSFGGGTSLVALGGSNVIWRPAPVRTPTPAPAPVSAPAPAVWQGPRLVPPTTVYPVPLIPAPTPLTIAAPTPAPAPTPTGTANGSVTSPGATGGNADPNAALATLLAGLFQSQPVSSTMAPVTFADPGTATVDPTATTSTPNKGVIILVLLAAVFGIWYYVKHRKGKRAA